MDPMAGRAFECPDVKPDGPGMIRASIVFVWHLGESGRWMNMMLRLGLGGSVTELSVTDGRRKKER